ncbi:MAG: PAS domain S-box protein [Anaerolineales bacterium]|nr:MAG: PAS domain S-box protein [Anaerolineales bacterium]
MVARILYIVTPVIACLLDLGFLILVILRRRRERGNLRFALFLLSMAIWSWGVFMLRRSANSQAAFTWAKISFVGMFFSPSFFLLFITILLRGRQKRWVYVSCSIISVLLATGVATTDLIVAGVATNRWGWVTQPGPLFLPAYLVVFSYLVYGSLLLAREYRQSRDELHRTRLRYVLLGFSIFLLGTLLDVLYLLGIVAYPLGMLANTLFVLCCAYAVVRYRLLDTSIVVQRVIAVIISGTIVTVLYAGGLLLLPYLFASDFEGILYISLIVTLLLLCIKPLREMPLSWVDRLFLPQRHDAQLMLQEVSSASTALMPLPELAKLILRRVAETLDIAHAIFLAPGNPSGTLCPVARLGLSEDADGIRFRPDHPLATHLADTGRLLRSEDLSSVPDIQALWANERRDLERLGSELFVPLVIRQRLAGLLVLGPKQDNQPYSLADEVILSTLANQTAVALDNARLYEESIEEKRRTETIVQEVFAGIMMVDPQMRIVALNPRAEAITGYASQEVLGKRLPEVFSSELWSEESLLYEAVATGERMGPAEATLVGKDGVRDILLGVTPLREGYLLSFADITRLKEVTRLKSDIVADVSHEFRAPLASIKAYTEVLLDNLEGDDKALRRDSLLVIDQETDRLTELINDLLDLSRLEARRFEEQRESLFIGEVIDDVIALLEIQARERNIAIHLDVPADLPSILADRRLMTTLVKNLVSNAIKFSHEAGRVDVMAREEDNNLVLNVVDRGIGISSWDLPHIFEKFYRVQSAREAGIRGTGLGLALAKDAAEVHGGTIEVESELGAGSRCTVTLPINRE